MTSLGTKLSSNGLLGEARTNLLLMLFLILDRVAEGTVPYVDPGHSNSALQTVRSLKGRQIWDNATAFLWYTVHYLYEKLDRESQVPPLAWRVFLCQILDSFFGQLQDGDSVQLPAVENTPIVFPRLAIQVDDVDWSCCVYRNSKNELNFESTEQQISIRLDRPGDRSLVKVSLPNGSHLLTSTLGLLFDADGGQKVANLTGEHLDTFTSQLSKALKLIELVNSEFSNEIRSIIKWYWPIYTPDKRTVHNSFTINSLHGGIFLSEHYSYLPMAEAIVHEFYHNQLSLLMTVDQHLKQPDHPTLYSPWRKDPRPLSGLYHGIYVFTGVMEYYQSGRQQSSLTKYHEYFRLRQEDICFQVRTAIAQVPKERLEPRGVAILEELRSIIDYHAELLEIRGAPLPESQMTHCQQWIIDNPKLVERLKSFST